MSIYTRCSHPANAGAEPTEEGDEERDAGTGRYPTEKYADKRKKTTVRETRKK